MKISLNEQIDEVRRELRMRPDVYSRQVATGKLRQSVAEYQMERMEAVLRTLEWLQDNEQRIKDVLLEGS